MRLGTHPRQCAATRRRVLRSPRCLQQPLALVRRTWEMTFDRPPDERPNVYRDLCHQSIVHDAALCYDRRVMNMPVTSSLPLDRATALDRHARRRTAGIPTVSLLVGPIEAGVRTWRRWANLNGPRVINAKPSLFPDQEWVRSVAEEVDLPVAAVHFMARRAGRDPEELLAEWRTKTPADRERFWNSLPRYEDDSWPKMSFRAWRRSVIVSWTPSPLTHREQTIDDHARLRGH